MIDLDAINGSINLVEWAERAGSKLHRAGHEWRGNCPLHGGDNITAFVIYGDEQHWHCFTGDCGGGDALGFIMKLQKCNLPEAIKIATGKEPGGISQADIAEMQARRAERAARELEEQIARAQAVLEELRTQRLWERYHAQLEQSAEGRAWWRNRGVPDEYQDLWQLGYETDRRIWIGKEIHSPTATIPIFTYGWDVRQIRHRIINAEDEGGKYRPEYEDLPAMAYLCDPDNDKPEAVVVVEGEIKSMVTFITLDRPGWQVIGVPGKKTPIDRIKENLNGAPEIYICCDPDTGKLNEAMARELGPERCRIVDTPIKIDDYILEAGITTAKLRRMFAQSRRVK